MTASARTITLRTLAATLTALVLVGLAAAAARAQGPVYTATAPTKGALYQDGQTGRYLLGGAWLYRADPTDVGPVAGLVAQRRRDRRLVAGDGSQRLQRRRHLGRRA